MIQQGLRTWELNRIKGMNAVSSWSSFLSSCLSLCAFSLSTDYPILILMLKVSLSPGFCSPPLNKLTVMVCLVSVPN